MIGLLGAVRNGVALVPRDELFRGRVRTDEGLDSRLVGWRARSSPVHINAQLGQEAKDLLVLALCAVIHHNQAWKGARVIHGDGNLVGENRYRLEVRIGWLPLVPADDVPEQ